MLKIGDYVSVKTKAGPNTVVKLCEGIIEFIVPANMSYSLVPQEFQFEHIDEYAENTRLVIYSTSKRFLVIPLHSSILVEDLNEGIAL